MRLISCFAALALSTSAALGADPVPLSPGTPAGVKPAQEIAAGNNTWLYIGLGAALIAGIAIAASSGDDDDAPTPVPPVTTTS